MKKDPDLIEALVSGEHEFEHDDETGEFRDEEGEVVCVELYIDTAWRDLDPHFSPKEPLLQKAINGDSPIHEDVDLGYGPAKLMSAAEVAKLAKVLAKPAKGLLSDRLVAALAAPPADPKKKSWKNAEEEMNHFLRTSFEDLRTFYAKAAAEKQAVIWTGA
jgi:hypothetical protein